ncbi:hypothetical protein HAX54_041595 [Datura stramonium]|uniref:Uncharacterized protein n=1 Tax=Datura stramonium TaxID=4076 RepID=A0ABS8W095_DATST|nr:hypothetical protein [Datura stramonium]
MLQDQFFHIDHLSMMFLLFIIHLGATEEVKERHTCDRPSNSPSLACVFVSLDTYGGRSDGPSPFIITGGDGSDLEGKSGNEATSSPAGGFVPMRGDVLKAKTLGFRDILCWQIEGKYKFYSLGWMSKAPRYYFPTMVREFYANYNATLEGVFGSSVQSAKVAEATTNTAEAAPGTESVGHAA